MLSIIFWGEPLLLQLQLIIIIIIIIIILIIIIIDNVYIALFFTRNQLTALYTFTL